MSEEAVLLAQTEAPAQEKTGETREEDAETDISKRRVLVVDEELDPLDVEPDSLFPFMKLY